MTLYTKQEFLKQIEEVEGITISIRRDGGKREYKKYDGGCNVGRITSAARFTTFLDRLKTFFHIEAEEVSVMMPNGKLAMGDALIGLQSDIRMKALRDFKTRTDDDNRYVRKGYQIELTQAMRDEFKDIGNRFKAMYLFPDAEVILINHPRFPGTVFDLQRSMISVVRSLTSVEGKINFTREVDATVSDEWFIIDGERYPRANIFFRED